METLSVGIKLVPMAVMKVIGFWIPTSGKQEKS
jgi:hypothetical protein